MRFNNQTRVKLGQTAFILFALVSLEIAVQTGWISGLILSAPSTTALKLWEDLNGTEIWTSLLTTGMEFFLAFSISFTLGVSLGILFFHFQPIRTAIEPILLAFYAAPSILLYPVFLTLFGLGSATVISVAVVTGSIPIIVNISVGLAGVEPIFIKLGRSLKATSRQMFWKIMVPAATPTIFTGLRLGLTFTLVSVIAVEFITYSGGLGKVVSWRYFIFDTEGVFSGIVFIITIAVLMNSLLGRTEAHIRTRWT